MEAEKMLEPLRGRDGETKGPVRWERAETRSETGYLSHEARVMRVIHDGNDRPRKAFSVLLLVDW
jgi:hypothetical protein